MASTDWWWRATDERCLQQLATRERQAIVRGCGRSGGIRALVDRRIRFRAEEHFQLRLDVVGLAPYIYVRDFRRGIQGGERELSLRGEDGEQILLECLFRHQDEYAHRCVLCGRGWTIVELGDGQVAGLRLADLAPVQRLSIGLVG